MSITQNDVINGYRLILGREPENDQVISRSMQKFPSLDKYREYLISSEEFKSKYYKYIDQPLDDMDPNQYNKLKQLELNKQELLDKLEGQAANIEARFREIADLTTMFKNKKAELSNLQEKYNELAHVYKEIYASFMRGNNLIDVNLK